MVRHHTPGRVHNVIRPALTPLARIPLARMPLARIPLARIPLARIPPATVPLAVVPLAFVPRPLLREAHASRRRLLEGLGCLICGRGPYMLGAARFIFPAFIFFFLGFLRVHFGRPAKCILLIYGRIYRAF